MNYLQLVQTAQRLLRATNDKLGAAPMSVVGQQGINDELVFFIKQAWLDIQNSNTLWRFLWKEGTLTLPQGADTITPTAIDDYESLLLAESDGRGRFVTMLVDGPDSETTVRFIPYPAFQQSYLTRGVRGPGQPGSFTVLPDGRFRFDLVADMPYTVKINYMRAPQELVDSTDEPLVPAKHRMAIVWWAIVHYYCTTRDGAEKFGMKAGSQLRREMQKMHNEQMMEGLVIEALP